MRQQAAALTHHPKQPSSEPAGGILQRKCACGQHTGAGGECAACRKKRMQLQRKATQASEPGGVPPIVHEVLRSPGRPLDLTSRAFMESRFGHDFSQVRIHTDPKADESAQAVNARAYTVGRHVVFGQGQYAPGTLPGKRLLAHELTHTVQQRFAASQPAQLLQVGPPDSAHERAAEVNEQSLVDGNLLQGRSGYGSPGNTLQRDDEAPIESERGEELTVRLDPDIIRLSLEVLRGEHRLGVEAGLTDPVSIPLDLLGIDLGIDSSRLQAILSYDNRCNRAFQAALVELEAGPVIGVDRVPWQVNPRVGVRIGSLRFDPGVGLGFEGSDFQSVLFTLNVVAASTETPPECIAPPSPVPPSETEPPSTPETPRREETPGTPPDRPSTTPSTPGRLPTYTLSFFYDSTLMRPESNDDFERLVALLERVPSLHAQLTGHTSLEGRESYNQRLSEQRAEAIRDRLVLAGINPARLHTLGMGEYAPAVTEPAISERSLLPSVESVRTLNRRVEVIVFDPTGRFEPRFPPFTLGRAGPAPSSFSLGVPELRVGR